MRMIDSLYPAFRKWSATGSIWIISDTHLGDPCCREIDRNWPDPQTAIDIIKKSVHKTDTLIHLGDVGEKAHLFSLVKAHKVLITGNHDRVQDVSKYFDEVYTGPLLIGEKLILSHEPIKGINWALNIHGHEHAHSKHDRFHLPLVSNRIKYLPVNLKHIIQKGGISKIHSIREQAMLERIRKDRVKHN